MSCQNKKKFLKDGNIKKKSMFFLKFVESKLKNHYLIRETAVIVIVQSLKKLMRAVYTEQNNS